VTGGWWPARAIVLATAVLLVICAASSRSEAQRTTIARLGFITPSTFPLRDEAFREELRRLGYVDGQNLSIEYRSANGSFDRLPALAAELAALKIDIIVAVATAAALAAKKAAGTTPVVMVGVADPVGAGLVASLARPGGNVTGTSTISADLVGKQVELLQEAFPKLSRVAVLWNSANTTFQTVQLERATTAAAKLKIQMHAVEARTPDTLEAAFSAIGRQRAEALLVLGDPMFGSHAARIAELAVRHRLPIMSAAREYAEAGMLMTYGPSYIDAYRRAAGYVDKLLKGGRAADLPVEQPTKFELIINGRTARGLGITLPRPLTLRADHVID
jgi:putative tryptophan/tyrosine transport system substrate-binding protein